MQFNFSPIIKWSGSKRSVAPLLSLLFPTAQCYFEPFVGGGALLPYRPSLRAVAGDIVRELVALWRLIQSEPEELAAGYQHRWTQLQRQGHTAYYEIRERFNSSHDPIDLLFLSRTCVNGLIRFNRDGHFNNSLHYTRPGISPIRLRSVLSRWNSVLHSVVFLHKDYRETLEAATKNDFVFLDPPYLGNRGRYVPNTFEPNAFFQELERLNRAGVKWLLTLDGTAGQRSYLLDIPTHLSKHALSIPTGNSPFTKLMGNSLDAVQESVYLNFDPTTEALRQFHKFLPHPSLVCVTHNVNHYALFGR